MSFQVIGTGSAAPACVKTNDDLSQFLDTSDEWIRTRTGIGERHVCTTETMSDLTEWAAKRALEDAGVSPQELDLILCSTVRGGLYDAFSGLCDSKAHRGDLPGL